MNDDIYDLLEGKPLTRENLYELQRNPKASGMGPGYDGNFSVTVESALRQLDAKNKIENRTILFENSEAMQRQGNDLTVDFLRLKMRDKRYCGSKGERDYRYIDAIETGFRELSELEDDED